LKFFQDVVAGTVVVTNASCCVVSTGISAALVTSVAVGAIHGDVVVVVVVVVVNGTVVFVAVGWVLFLRQQAILPFQNALSMHLSMCLGLGKDPVFESPNTCGQIHFVVVAITVIVSLFSA
jgi:hypothetical protein